MKKPLIAVPLGDPAGIGPEIVVRSIADKELFQITDCIVIGDKKVVENAVRITGEDLTVNVVEDPAEGDYREGVLNLIDLDNIDMEKFEFGKISGMCGKAAFGYIKKSIELAMEGKADAVATTPINKESLRAGEINFIGHTEIFGALTGTEDPLTMFETNGMRVFFLTRHLSLRAMLETKKTTRTACCLLVDKEEIGSVGATGMQSRFFENTLAELMEAMGEKGELRLRRALANSKMLSSDVSSGFDPLYASAFDKKNVAYLGGGMVFNKFTGSRGKSGSNDANAEYIAELRAMMDKHKVRFQTAELGKVDLGGGGTIAYIMSLYGMQVIDCGVPVLSMHAPWEVTSIVDLYEVTKGYKAFLAEA